MLFTDAGDNAGAAITACGRFQKLCVFDETQKDWHINTKEFFMTVEALCSANLRSLSQRLLCRIDNKVALRWLEAGDVSDSVIRDREIVLAQMARFKEVLPKFEAIEFAYVPSR